MENMENDLAQWSQTRKLTLVSEGRQVIDLSMINPDIPPSKRIIDKLIEASMRPQNHRYSVARGLRKLREAFATKYQARWGVSLSAEEEICITSGSKEAVLLLLRWCIPEHSVVLLPAPYYPAHISAAKLGGHDVQHFELGISEDDTLLAIEAGLVTHRPAVLILNFPNNPTGCTVSKQFYEKLAVLVERHGTLVYNDFVYGELAFSGCATSMMEVPYFRNNGLESYSISKAYGVPGWRVAAMCGASRWVKRLAELKSKTDYGLFIPLQVGAAAALEGELPKVAEEYALRARGFVKDLTVLGFRVTAPQAGCAVWCKPERCSVDYLVRELLERHGILISCGDSFGERFSNMVRIALVATPATLSNVIEAIKEL